MLLEQSRRGERLRPGTRRHRTRPQMQCPKNSPGNFSSQTWLLPKSRRGVVPSLPSSHLLLVEFPQTEHFSRQVAVVTLSKRHRPILKPLQSPFLLPALVGMVYVESPRAVVEVR